MMMKAMALSVALVLGAPVAAAISSVNFTGFGAVTFSEGSLGGFVPPPVGTPVIGTGTITFAQPLPDNFTGGVRMTQYAVDLGRYTFSFSIGGAQGNSDANAFHYGSAYFREGALTSVSFYTDNDPNFARLDGSARGGSWYADLVYGEPFWGGTFFLDAEPGPIPEPTVWVLFIGGFAMVGLAMRRRTAVLAR